VVAVYPIEVNFSADGSEVTVNVLGRAEPPYRRVATVAPSAADIAALAGRYRSAELGTEWTIRIDNGKALIKGRAQGEHPLEPISRDVWTAEDGFYALVRGADGRVAGFDFSASRMTRIRFERVG